MRPRRVLVGCLAALSLLTASLSIAPHAGAAVPETKRTATAAVSWLVSQQQDDGRVGTGDGATETVDAVLAIAETAQPTLAYDRATARAAVTAVRSDTGETPLTYLDGVAAADINAGRAAEIVLAAAAVGLDPRAFDPRGDGAKDLVAEIDADRADDGSFGFFYQTLLVALVHPLVGADVPKATIDLILEAQRDDGGWNYSGDQATDEFSGSDTDVTGLAVQALVAGGVSPAASSVHDALAFLASQQNDDGGFHPSYSTDSNPSSTRNAVIAIAAAGFDPLVPCWRTAAGAAATGYVTPDVYLRGQADPSGRIGPETDFLPTQYTSAAVQALVRSFQPVVRGEREACPTTGYRLVATDGGVFTHGSATFAGSTGGVTLNRPIVTSASTPTDAGYWLFASDGGVFTFGDAGFFGSTGAITLNAPIVAAASTPTGGGYWLFAGDGGVFTFGDAGFHGSTGDKRLNAPVVAAASTPSGRGYWLFAADGGVFTFGDAAFEGSTGDMTLTKPVVGASASRPGRGYVLFASDGGVFTFGDASFLGSMGGRPLNAPVVGGARSEGDGYYLVASDGGVFAFGAPFLGSEGAIRLNAPIATIAV